MCAAKQGEPLTPPLDQYQLMAAFLHRKETKAKSKPLSPQLAWLLSQTNSTESGLFSPLPAFDPRNPPLDSQSYTQWKAMFDLHKLTHPRRMRRNTIILQPLSYTSKDYTNTIIERQVMRHLQQFCEAFFHGNQVHLVAPLDMSTARKLTRRVHSGTGREQILVDDVMRFLKAQRYPKAYCIVGVTIVDLYPGEEWNFTLGHAAFVDGIAVCSFGRYFNSQDVSMQTTVQRQMKNMWILVRVLTHEIGHLFGLSHCFYYNCAMNESSSILDAAHQPLFLCPICLRKLHKVLKFSLKERYVHLAQLCGGLNELFSFLPEDPTSELDEISEQRCIVPKLQDSHQVLSSEMATECPKQSSQATATIEGVVSRSAEEDGRPDAAKCDEKVLECPGAHFRRASEWLRTTIASLDRFVEQVGTDSCGFT